MDTAAQTAFLQSLAEIMASLLGIVAAAIAAFYVFLSERQAQYDLRIEDQTQIVRGKLLELRYGWNWSYRAMLPTDFPGSYRSACGTLSRADFVRTAAWDLATLAPRMTEQFNKAALAEHDTLGHLSGRVYFWLLTEALAEITGGGLPTEPMLEAVFPASVAGLGFEEWRASYSQAGQALAMLLLWGDPDRYVSDFEQWANEQKGGRFPPNYAQNAVRSVAALRENVNAALRERDTQSALREKYAPLRRLHWQWFLVLGVIAFVTGIVAPLLMVVWTRQFSALGAATLLLVSFVATIGTICVFALDLVRVPHPGSHEEYMVERWYRPLLERLISRGQNADPFGMIDLEFETEAGIAATSGEFEPRSAEALSEYLRAGQEYNGMMARLFDLFTGIVRDDPVLSRLRPGVSSGSGRSLSLQDLVDEGRLGQILSALKKVPVNVSVQLQFSQWQRGVAGISSSDLSGSYGQIEEAFHRVGKKFRDSPLVKQADVARTRLHTASEVYRKALLPLAQGLGRRPGSDTNP